jgi:hypothetical protein
MAAKQGLSAQWSQASEDAKRALSLRTKSSWFSNLNTTCTIKSAPPRSPEVLSLLATKSGFLLKRNEQHVWQSRWCCVVPHMFLYYFDADIGDNNNGTGTGTGTGHPNNNNKIPSIELQQELNSVINAGNRKTTAPRSSLNLFGTVAPATNMTSSSSSNNNNNNNNNAHGIPEDAAAASSTDNKFSTLQPAGIIDLECYNSVHRSPANPMILELAGDDSVNPDLRSFYFFDDDDGDDNWQQALLGGRHNSLVDERDAYRQVCDGFSQQLQQLHSDLDSAEKKTEHSNEECYRIRSSQEEVRRKCFALIQEALERGTTVGRNAQPRRSFRTDLETVRQQDMGLVPAVQLISDFCAVLEESCTSLQEQVNDREQQLRSAQDGDHLQSKELDSLLKQKEITWLSEKEELQKQVQRLEKQLQVSQKSCKDAQQDVSAQKMEFTMYLSSSKSKMMELQAHKKILKKEVIVMRQKFDEVGSELSLQKHHSKISQTEVEQERRKAGLLERYVEKMESQVKVQQNMMELMSQTCETASRASGSQYGGRPFQNGSPSYNNNQGSYDNNNNNNNNNNNQGGGSSPYGGGYKEEPQHDVVVVNTSNGDDHHHGDETHSVMLRKAMADDDNKSHMSELTEDRTQKHFFTATEASDRSRLPPTYIDAHPKLDTISASAGSRSVAPKLSVAQRARLGADKGSPVRIRAPHPLVHTKSNSSQSSFLNSLGKSLTDALDNSVLGLPDPELSPPSSSSSEEEEDDLDDENEQPISETGSVSLAQRQHMQRAKQIAFLQEQGLLKSRSGV